MTRPQARGPRAYGKHPRRGGGRGRPSPWPRAVSGHYWLQNCSPSKQRLESASIWNPLLIKIILPQTPTASGQHRELSVPHGSRSSQAQAGRAGPLLTRPCRQGGPRGRSRGPEGVCAERRRRRDARREPPAAPPSACSPLSSSGARQSENGQVASVFRQPRRAIIQPDRKSVV